MDIRETRDNDTDAVMTVGDRAATRLIFSVRSLIVLRESMSKLFRSENVLMAITSALSKEEILPNQIIQVRTTTVVEEDGVELGRSHHRHVVVPGDDVTGKHKRQDIANAVDGRSHRRHQASIASAGE